MTGFATVPDALRKAGKTAEAAVTALRSADCGQPVGELATALPGSASGPAATEYADHWTATFRDWCNEAHRHAGNLTDAAKTYSQADHSGASQLEQSGRLVGPN